MPITEAKFKELPKVGTTKRGQRVGRKVDWDKVYEHLRGKGWVVREVHEYANKSAILVEGQTISRVRCKRWLDKLEEKKLANVAEDEETGAFVYFVK